MDNTLVLVPILGAVVGATWVLRSKLADIELAIKTSFIDLETRVVSLEEYRKAREK